jgi:pyruvate,orthophosphate dikinase
MTEAPWLIGCDGDAGELPPAEHIGAKAHNLARMAALGMPVPPAFVIGTGWCAAVDELQPALWAPALQSLETATRLRFGDTRHPLLLSVRSGAAVSMPGMMDTVLDIGLGERTLQGFVRHTGNPRLAWDAYRRLVAGFGEVVLGVDAAAFEVDLQAVTAGRDEPELDFAELRQLTRLHLATVQRLTGQPFPQDAHEQLRQAIVAVFRSWNGAAAREYRRLQGYGDELGTAVTVQAMVFGNAGGTSGAGVGFTRHPSSGEREPWVDFVFKAQGEDVVSGRRRAQDSAQLEAVAPELWQELLGHLARLESAFGDMQDFEFTVENGRLWLLQTRNGKRTPQARARIALDLHDEGLIDAGEALRRTHGLDEAALALEQVSGDGGDVVVLGTASSACSGVASGEIALDEERARARHAAGAAVVLVRQDAETRDIAALDLARGLLTARGARTSHAAVVARQLGRVCLVGCEGLAIDPARRSIQLGGCVLSEGETITIDGNRGAIYRGAARTVRVAPAELMQRLARLRSAH